MFFQEERPEDNKTVIRKLFISNDHIFIVFCTTNISISIKHKRFSKYYL